MGLLEAAVVVYLRQLYYPEGFSFPLKPMALEGLFIESLREIATVIMLVSVGMAAGRIFSERLAYVLYCFGIWDIFYYVWLKVLLDWPQSFLTWDLLFLVPIVWAGPVAAPITCAFTMVAIGVSILYLHGKGSPAKIGFLEWAVLSLGGAIIFSSFVWEYARIMMRGSGISYMFSLGKDPQLQSAIARHVPDSYNWYLFAIGECMMLGVLSMLYRRAGSNSADSL